MSHHIRPGANAEAFSTPALLNLVPCGRKWPSRFVNLDAWENGETLREAARERDGETNILDIDRWIDEIVRTNSYPEELRFHADYLSRVALTLSIMEAAIRFLKQLLWWLGATMCWIWKVNPFCGPFIVAVVICLLVTVSRHAPWSARCGSLEWSCSHLGDAPFKCRRTTILRIAQANNS
jgi:hypothetical protein